MCSRFTSVFFTFLLIHLFFNDVDAEPHLSTRTIPQVSSQKTWSAGTLHFVDVSSAAGFSLEPSGTHAASIADFNNDGFPDIYINSQEDDRIENNGYKGNYLYKNCGDGTFVRIEQSAGVVDEESWAHSALFFDYDHDGDYDLAVGHGHAENPAILTRRMLYRNNGDGTFSDVSDSVGFVDTGCIGTRSIIAGDFNGDCCLDIYFSNWTLNDIEKQTGYDTEGYFGTATGHLVHDTEPNCLNDNPRQVQGMIAGDLDCDGDIDVMMGNHDTDDGIAVFKNTGDGTFRNDTSSGLPRNGEYKSVNLSDVNSDGYLDALIVNSDSAQIYINDRDGTFTPSSQIFMKSSHCQSGCAIYNGSFGDFDNDGDSDLLIDAGEHKLWLNDGEGIFLPVDDETSGLTYPATEEFDPRFPSLLDYDNDGDLDVIIAGHKGPGKLYQNRLDNNQSIRVNLIGPAGDLGGFGSKVWVYESGRSQDPSALVTYQESMASHGYCVQSEPELHFGIGNRPDVDILVQFVDGSYQLRSNVEAGTVTNIIAEAALPVELVSFTACMKNEKVLLTWTTASESDNYGFEVERSSLAGWKKVGFVRGKQSSLALRRYEFLDALEDIEQKAEPVKYRLKQVDLDGSSVYSEVIEVALDVPKIFQLLQNYPNPFNSFTTISFKLTESSDVHLQVLNMRGQVLETLINGAMDVGTHKVEWDASHYGSAVYLFKLTSGNWTAVQKAILLK